MSENLPLTFREWLSEFCDDFKIDVQAEPLVKKLGQWAFRHEKFNVPALRHHIDKGILLNGNFGTGKTEIMRLLQKYLVWLQSPYKYKMEIVWQFGPAYKNEGFHAFNKIQRGNWFFDELALLNQEGQPYLEMSNDFGNKVLIGEQLILIRYNEFKKFGYQTHFTTNLEPDQLKSIYGQRCFSRLVEMCNFIPYTGRDRRLELDRKPTFHINENNYAPADAQVPSEQINIDLKQSLNGMYQQFVATNNFDNIKKSQLRSAFELLKGFNCEVADDQALRLIRFDVEARRAEEVSQMVPISRAERGRIIALKSMYQKNNLDADEDAYVWGLVKIIAVENYFKSLKDQSVERIFDV